MLQLRRVVGLAAIAAAVHAMGVCVSAQLVGCWSFNEEFGIVVNDLTDGKKEGLINNHFVRITEDTNRFLQLDGNESFVDFGTSPLFNFYDAFSLEVWVYVRGPVAGEQFIVGKAFASYGLSYYTNGRVYLYGGYSGTNNVSYPLPLNQWVHIVGTVDNTIPSGYNMFLYVNGTRVGYKRSTNRPDILPDIPLVSGTDYEKSSFLAIDLDEIRVYNHALTQQEITANYQAGTEKLEPATCNEQWIAEGNGIVGDLNYDCQVDLADFAILSQMWAYTSN